MKLGDNALKPLDSLYAPTNLFDLSVWCKEYERFNKKPATLLNRFSIGFYQIHQGMSWFDNGVNKYESFAAACLHFIMVMERLNLATENAIEEFKLKKIPFNYIDYKKLLQALSASQQMLFYGSPSNKTQRASRYNPKTLETYLGRAIKILLEAIPVDQRQECFEIASTIMTKELK